MGGAVSVEQLNEEEEQKVLNFDVSVKSIAFKMKQLEMSKEPGVVVMAGAGISVSAGIPDFRSPDTGLYANLQKYDLPTPQSIFDIEYFREKPEAFNMLAKEMWPGNFNPTPTHFFIKLLQDKSILKRCFTQNIDTLEREAGIDQEMLVEAHGSFGEAHCIDCSETYPHDWIKDKINNEIIPRCLKCNGLVKPNIVFFGENLPAKYSEKKEKDLPEAKVLLVMGTSLSVTPFCNLIHEANARTPRLLLNLTSVASRREKGTKEGFRFDEVTNYRDAALLQDCDSGVRLLCRYLQWENDLDKIIDDFYHRKGISSPPQISITNNKSTTLKGQSERLTTQTNKQRTGGLRKTSSSTSDASLRATSRIKNASAPHKSNSVNLSKKKEDEMIRLLSYNWRAKPKPLPQLHEIGLLSNPVNSADVSGGGSHSMEISCVLCEPATFEELASGGVAWFRIGFENNEAFKVREDRDHEYIGLYPALTSSCLPTISYLTTERISVDFLFNYSSPARIELMDDIEESEDPETGLNAFEKKRDLILSQRHQIFEPPYAKRAIKVKFPSALQPPELASSSSSPTISRVVDDGDKSRCGFELWYVDDITKDVLARWGPIYVS